MHRVAMRQTAFARIRLNHRNPACRSKLGHRNLSPGLSDSTARDEQNRQAVGVGRARRRFALAKPIAASATDCSF